MHVMLYLGQDSPLALQAECRQAEVVLYDDQIANIAVAFVGCQGFNVFFWRCTNRMSNMLVEPHKRVAQT
jgi:hypothetical protein